MDKKWNRKDSSDRNKEQKKRIIKLKAKIVMILKVINCLK